MRYKNSDDNRYRVQFMRSTEELMDQLTVKEFISYLEENAEFEDYTVEYIDKKCVKCRAYDLTEENSKLHKEFLVTEDGRVFYWRSLISKDEYWVCSTKQTKGRRTRKRDSTMGKAGEINPLGCDNENISYNSLMEIMGVVSERLQANTDTIKQDMINWLTKLRKQLLEANGGHTEADLQRELSRKSKLLDAYLDGILNKQEYQTKAEELDERIIQLKAETEKNKANSGDIAEIDKVLANIDEEVSRYVDGNEKLKVEYLLEHLEQVQIFPDKVIVIVPILSEGIVVEKTQYVSREKRCRQDYLYENDRWSGKADKRRDIHVWIRWKGFVKGTLKSGLPD